MCLCPQYLSLWPFSQSTFLLCSLCFVLFLFAFKKSAMPLKAYLWDCHLVNLLIRWDGMKWYGWVKRHSIFSLTFSECSVLFWSIFLMNTTITSPTRFCASGRQGPQHFLIFLLFGRKRKESNEHSKCQYICI